MLRVSDNGVAEMLVKEIGSKVSNGVGTWASGLEAVRAQLANWKVPDTGVSLVDGSGLSSDDHLTCQAILGVVSRYKIGDPLVSGLPVAATSGTLLGDFKGSPVAGQLLAKTGTLRNVRALAGLLPRQGHLVQFAYVMNEPGIGTNDPVSVPRWNQLMAAFLAFPYTPALGAYEPAAVISG
jgi:D-alanyl-D-alanine carboxypeptidase/D-alanyl-D-alanine-endopeptidase (penicillin-binding protein 4)